MSRLATHALIWSSEHNAYTLYDEGQQQVPSLLEGDETWLAWLANRSSFSFQGRNGHLNLLKEMRARGNEGYWYAYRRQGKRRIKQYAGRTPDLTIARLEELAHTSDLQTNKIHAPDQLSRQAWTGYELSRQMKRTSVVLETPQQLPRERVLYQISQLVPSEHVVYDTSPTLSAAVIQRPLLVSRLCPPPLQGVLIPRERLLALLDEGLERRLTLLMAPAGSGKTTLLTQWLAWHRQQVAWLSLEREQNDPQRFLAYLIGALERVHPHLGRTILTSVSAQEAMTLDEGMVLLLNELAALPTQITIVLDNYHLIESQCIHRALKQRLPHSRARSSRSARSIPFRSLTALQQLLPVIRRSNNFPPIVTICVA